MRSYVEIDQKQLSANYEAFKKHGDYRTLFVVVKGNAYGHGLKEVVRILDPCADAYCVEDALELEQLRKISRKQCLVLGHVAAEEILKEHISNTIFSLFAWEQIPLFREMSRKFKVQIQVHIKIDALMGRQGFLPGEVSTLCDILKNAQYIEVQGIYSHLSSVKSGNTIHTKHQHEVFRQVVHETQAALGKKLLQHIDATGGIVFHQGDYPAARIGAGIYGIWPTVEEVGRYKALANVRPVMRWVSGITQIKKIPKGHPVGYDKTFIADKAIKIAVVPQGYADGYDRELSNCGFVLIKNTRCAVLGRVSMNVMVVDVSHLGDVMVGDPVVLLGSQGAARITAQEIAQLAHTIPYEIVTRVSPLLPRTIV